MMLLQSGFPKSGNYWLYKILHNMLLESGIQIKSYARSHPIYEEARTWPYFEDQAGIDYLEIEPDGLVFRKGSFTEPIPDLQAYLSRCTHVWTHSYWQPECEQVFGAFDGIVYIIRDPRDVLISASRYFFTPFMQSQHQAVDNSPEEYLHSHLGEVLLSWVQHVGGYLQNLEAYNIYPVFYERLLADLPGELRKLGQYLGTPLNDTALTNIEQKVTFDSMQSESPHHVRKGRANQWRYGLDAAQQQQAEQIAGAMLDLLSYPRASDPNEAGIPVLPSNLDKQALQAAIAESRGGIARQASLALQFLTSRRPIKEKIHKGMDFMLGRGRWKSTD